MPTGRVTDRCGGRLPGWRRRGGVPCPRSIGSLQRSLPGCAAAGRDRRRPRRRRAAAAGRPRAGGLGERAEPRGAVRLHGDRPGRLPQQPRRAVDAGARRDPRQGSRHRRRLRVRGPRIAAQPGSPARTSALLEDVVCFDAERHLPLVGSASRLLKINGRRVHLDQVEAALRSPLPGTACPLPSRARTCAVSGSTCMSPGRQRRRCRVERACRSLPAWQRPRTVRAA